jgi:hypothetical protein
MDSNMVAAKLINYSFIIEIISKRTRKLSHSNVTLMKDGELKGTVSPDRT